MYTLRAVSMSLLFFACASTAHAVPIPGLFNTGVDNASLVLPGNSVDPHYTLIASADPSFPGPNAIVPTVIPTAYWIANNALSKWIAPANIEDFPGAGTPHPGGDYTYRLSFSLAGIDPTTASITGKLGADNSVTVRLNGAATAIATSSYNPLVAFTLSTGFSAGINQLDFVVHNIGTAGTNPTGLRVQDLAGSGTAIVGVGDGPDVRGIELSSPFPNPARGRAQFAFALPRAGRVRLAIYDLAGRIVRSLAEGDYPAGRFDSSWDGLDADGSQARAGMYLLDLRAAGTHVTRRIVWIR